MGTLNGYLSYDDLIPKREGSPINFLTTFQSILNHSNMEGIFKDKNEDLMEGDDVSMKSAREDEFLNLSRFTVYHSAQDLDNPKAALFQNHERPFHKVGFIYNLSNACI